MLCGNIIRARCIVVTYVILQNFQYCIYSICITDIVWFVPINFEPVIMIVMTLYRWCTVVSVMLKYDEPEVENVAWGCSLSATFSTVGHHISVLHERPCFICFVVWPNTSLKLYIVFWDGGETRVSMVCHLKMHRDLSTVCGSCMCYLECYSNFTAKSHWLMDLNCIKLYLIKYLR